MGTFWTMDSSTVMKMGEAGDGFMGVMPYRYYYDTSAKAPMLDKIRAHAPRVPEHGLHPGLPGRHAVRAESAKRCVEANKPLTGPNLKAALNSASKTLTRVA